MNNDLRTKITILVLSAMGVVGIALDEGYTNKAIPDPVLGIKVPTIGFGATDGVKMDDVTTPPKALQRLLRDVQPVEGALKKCVTVPLYQREYDALVNLGFNIGQTAVCKSTAVRRMNQLDYAGGCEAILLFKYVGTTDCSAPGNKTCPGLWQRRLRLRSQCLGEATP